MKVQLQKQRMANLYGLAPRLLLVCMLILAFTASMQAQVSVTATSGTTGPTSYTTVNGALAAISKYNRASF
jgi:hypothetical protein